MANPVTSVADMQANWLKGMQSAGPKWAKKIAQVQTAPNQLAAAPDAMARYVANTAAAVASGKYAAKNNAVTLGDWQAACAGKQGNLGQGAMLKKAKYNNASPALNQAAQQVRDAVSAMPKGGSANAAARSAASSSIMKKAFGKND